MTGAVSSTVGATTFSSSTTVTGSLASTVSASVASTVLSTPAP